MASHHSWLRVFSVALFVGASLLACDGDGGASSEGDGGAGADGVGSGGGPTSGNGPDGPWIAFPVEVLGSGAPDEPVVEARELPLGGDVDPKGVTRLFVQCHRCGFYDSPEFQKLDAPLTRIKVSLRVAGDEWIDVTEDNVELDAVSLAHGGFNGGLLTTTFHVELDAATRARLVRAPETNSVEFRFNGTDGNSNGFRILDLQFQDDSGKNLSPVTRRFADIGLEKSEADPDEGDVTRGAELWHGQGLLLQSPVVKTKIRAACSSCHAEDGRDLQYFNYSNHSIVQRSRFHGLSEEEGEQIVAYLRSSLYDAVPHVAAAAPWNPPYQPGPGLDDRPSVEWAAGAGLDAVLPDGAAFVKEFVGQDPNTSGFDVSQNELDAAHGVDPTQPLDTREMRVPLQFPDWNAWLPILHPLDIWTPSEGETAGLFETRSPDTENPQKVFERVRDWLEEHQNPNGVYGDWSHLTADERQQMHSWFNDLGGKTIAFGGGGRGTRESGNPSEPFGGEIGAARLMQLLDEETRALAEGAAVNGFSKQAFIERSLFGLIHWLGVKQWEIAHEYGIEGPQPYFRGKKTEAGEWVGEGEERGWPYSWPSVFYIAPHMIYAPEQTDAGLREFYFSWEPRYVSYYRTNQWYQLQMTLNPGWAGASVGPMDWPYHLGFTTGLADDLIQNGAPDWIPAAHLARFFQVRVKLAQLANTDISFDTPDPNEPNNLFRNTGMNSRADLLFKLGVAEITHRGAQAYQQTKFTKLDAIQPGLHLKFVNSALELYDDFLGDSTSEQFRRCDPTAMMFGDSGEFESKSGQRFCLDAVRTPLPVDENGEPYLPGGWVDWTTEQNISWGIIAARQLGADEARVERLETWLESLY